ncbi:MAG: electron transfer flavoprotein subunit beta/FixA family protein [Candidatus Aminicenantes bacterium]|nr:electron transfer flavoprotein subunit beta/FixA family protein [Candidatus Aminicenantes bacterium]
MNLLVFVKRVPDTESKIRIAPDGQGIVEEGLNFIISPYDEYAVEEALRLREAKGGKVTVVCVGKEEALLILRKCLAMGADEALLIKDSAPESFEGLRVAAAIASLVKQRFPNFDLLLFGKQSFGADNAQVPAMVAELLGIPQVNVVVKLIIEGRNGVAYREIEGALEKVVFSLPAVISAQKGLNEPRYETLKGIMAAKKKEIPIIPIDELGISEDFLTPKMEIIKLEMPPTKKAGRIIQLPPEEAAKEIVRFLREEAKII